MKAIVRNVSASTALFNWRKIKTFCFCGVEFLHFDDVLIHFVLTSYCTKLLKKQPLMKKCDIYIVFKKLNTSV